MIEIWIPITIAAGFFQNLRSAVQKKLKDKLSNTGAAYSRFLYALPVALLYLSGLQVFGGFELPAPNARFFLYCFIGGIFQIMFTVFLLWTFSFKSFAVGTTFSKLEVIMVAIVAAVLLGETLNGYAIFAIFVSSLGIFALSMGQEKMSISVMLKGLVHKSTALGLMSAICLGFSSAFFRGATLALDYDPFFVNAAYSLVVVLTIQSILAGIYLVIREPGQFTCVIKNWRVAGLAGVAGALATMCWFTAFTLEKAAYVRAVGQTELIFTFIATLLFFREKISVSDVIGVGLITSGIFLLLLFG